MRRVVVPPIGWAILRRDGWYYPAYLIGETPRRYAFIWWRTEPHPCRFRQRALASDCATRFHKGIMRDARLHDSGDLHDFIVLSEPSSR
jgi:hypothetical protein